MAVVLVTSVSLTAGQTLGRSAGASGSEAVQSGCQGRNMIKLTPQKDKLVNDKVASSPQQKPSKKTAPTKALQRASTDIKGKRKIDTRLASDDKDKSSSSEELEHVMAQPIMPTEIAKDAPSGSRPWG
ncbi:hypothetical protein PCASD_07564 [Puccinia coronata f. sp. avenae]|uniref:Uncharacterized protein n=1 Tax=Puccinia coronata f. sp. avenae TaxID=200324 RepID=A0A2N5TGQ2_9BASI|nr:hypothetical protein PCASD_07564 [Puccinia coronata f. sp. avenae]